MKAHQGLPVMMGWRTRIGFLVPPGNPTVEPEMTELAPTGVSVHFTRLSASGGAGTHSGQEERNRSQIASLDEATRLLAMVSPQVIVMAHTATSYTLGREAEAELVRRQEIASGTRFTTPFASVLEALTTLNVRRIAYATPYDADLTEQGRAHLAQHGFDVVGVARLEGCAIFTRRRPSVPTRSAKKLIDQKQRPSSSAAPGCRRWQCSRSWRTTLANRLSPPPLR
jgi:maleate cis-trans isomerase